jgi:hypothetical protein
MLMKSLTLLLCGLLFALAASAQEAPRFLQPTAESFSDEEIALLGRAVEELDALLATHPWGSQMEYSERGWGSEQYARYSAGILQSLGYRVTLVGRETADGTPHIWLAVAVDLPTRIAWVPVDATPPKGEVQTALGRIPWEAEPSSAWPSPFAADLMSYDIVLPIGANEPPIAKIDRVRSSGHEPGDSVWLSAFASVDPDGGIVLYVWDFGDGESLVSTTARVRHRFTDSGTYSVRLTVVDDSGSRASSEPAEIAVVRYEEPNDAPSSGGCGCG